MTYYNIITKSSSTVKENRNVHKNVHHNANTQQIISNRATLEHSLKGCTNAGSISVSRIKAMIKLVFSKEAVMRLSSKTYPLSTALMLQLCIHPA